MSELRSESVVFKYQCPTNRDENGCFRQGCDLCNCAPWGKMVLDPGKVLRNEEEELKCPHTGEALKLVDVWEEVHQPVIMGFRMNENQVRQDRMKRSRDHFKREIFDTLHPSDKKALARNDTDLKQRLK